MTVTGMLSPVSTAAPIAQAPDDAQHAKLREVAHAMEGMFLRQLFSAMRANATVSGASAIDGSGAGGEMFNSMLDDALADKAAERTQRGLGDALYKQLSQELESSSMTSASSKVGA